MAWTCRDKRIKRGGDIEGGGGYRRDWKERDENNSRLPVCALTNGCSQHTALGCLKELNVLYQTCMNLTLNDSIGFPVLEKFESVTFQTWAPFCVDRRKCVM